MVEGAELQFVFPPSSAYDPYHAELTFTDGESIGKSFISGHPVRMINNVKIPSAPANFFIILYIKYGDEYTAIDRTCKKNGLFLDGGHELRKAFHFFLYLVHSNQSTRHTRGLTVNN